MQIFPEPQTQTEKEKKMKYRARPVIVTAYKILSVGDREDGGINCALDNGTNAIATQQMTARMAPAANDYWVVQEDGYTYLNPKDVFERKYEPIKEIEGKPDAKK
jgi:hypothetical protein